MLNNAEGQFNAKELARDTPEQYQTEELHQKSEGNFCNFVEQSCEGTMVLTEQERAVDSVMEIGGRFTFGDVQKTW